MQLLGSIQEYAKIHHRHPSGIIRRCAEGQFRTAEKIGIGKGMWIIDLREPLIDHRMNTGKYKGKPRNRKKQVYIPVAQRKAAETTETTETTEPAGTTETF